MAEETNTNTEPAIDPPQAEPAAEPAQQPDTPPQEKTYTEEEYTALQKELETLRREKLTQEELSRLELTKRETEVANREAVIRDKENRLYAISALEQAQLVSNGIATADLIPFVMDSTTQGIDSKVKALSALLDKRAKAETERIYQGAGRQPHQVHNEDAGSGNPAFLFGKERAAEQAKAKAIREKYTGGAQ